LKVRAQTGRQTRQTDATEHIITQHSRRKKHVNVAKYNEILCVSKKFPPLYSVNSSNLNRFSKYLHCWKAYEICYKAIQYNITHTTLGVLLHYLGKLKIQISDHL